MTDPLGELVYRVAGTWRSAVSVNAGWAGCSVGPDGEQQCWALAIGHAPSGLGHVVSFAGAVPGTRLHQMTLPSEAPIGFWLIHDGLWAAAAVGCFTHVRLTVRSALIVHPLYTVTDNRRSG